MAGVNKVILLGHLGQDPEVKHFDNGSVVAKMSLATTETYKNKAGEKVSNTEWHSLEVWEGQAKVAEQYLKKGSQIFVEGKIKTDKWTTESGENRYSTKIRVTSFTMLGGGNGSQQSEQEGPSEAVKAANDIPDNEDELPF